MALWPRQMMNMAGCISLNPLLLFSFHDMMTISATHRSGTSVPIPFSLANFTISIPTTISMTPNPTLL